MFNLINLAFCSPAVIVVGYSSFLVHNFSKIGSLHAELWPIFTNMAFVRHLGYEHLNFVNTPALCWNCRGVRGFSPPPQFMSTASHYRAMHFSAKRGIAIACRLSVCLSVCNVGEL